MTGSAGATPNAAEGGYANPGSVADRLDHILRVLGRDAVVMETLDVSRGQLRRWREGRLPDPEDRDRIIGLDAVIALLSGYLSESSIPRWLRGSNAHLDNRRPISVLREGRVSDVIAAIEAQKSGAFA